MLIPAITIHRLRAELEGPEHAFRVATAPIDLDPLEVVRAGTALFGAAVFFEEPDGRAFGGLGEAARLVGSGPGRFEQLVAGLESYRGLPVPWFAGFSFAPDGPTTPEWSGFSPAELLLPQVSMRRNAGATHLTVVVPPGGSSRLVLETLAALETVPAPLRPEPGDHTVESRPSTEVWRNEVAEAIAAIKAGALAKVVLTRSVVIRAGRSTEAFDLVHHLRSAYPQCYSFGWQRNGATFVGASPELLVERRGAQVRSNPLAGSAPRGEGEDDDRALGAALMASEKDRIEHALVVEDIAERLGPITTELVVPPEPSLRQMATVQHLSTEIAGRLEGSISALDLADVLHPTPAVGGSPRGDAVAFIDKVEGLDRGWYTGGVGWVDGSGDGTLALGLRCALVRGATAHLYAGAGIVADSDPENELVETRLKFRPMVSLLAAT